MKWTIDPVHSSVGFAVRHMMIATVRGKFTRFTGEVELDEKDPANSRAVGEIDAASIDTGNADRDAHLRGPDFFDADRHPVLRFVVKGIESAGEHLRLTGDLTIRDVTREVALDAELTDTATDPWGKTRRGVLLNGTIDRKEFGLVWNQPLETGGVLVSEKVKLEVELELVQGPAEAADELAAKEAESTAAP